MTKVVVAVIAGNDFPKDGGVNASYWFGEQASRPVQDEPSLSRRTLEKRVGGALGET